MRIEEKFNKRSANLVEVVPPAVRAGPQHELGVCATFYSVHDSGKGQITMHLTPLEALAFAGQLIEAATRQLKYESDRRAAQQPGDTK